MTTVIDSLVVQLGLDPKKFTTEQKKFLKGLDQTKDKAAKVAGEIEDKGKQGAEFFRIMRNEAIRLFAAFIGFRGLKEFAVDTVNSTSAMGRLAHNIGMTTSEISLWENAVKSFGGDSTAAGQSMSGLTQEFQHFALTGQSSVVPFFRAMGVAITDVKTGKLRSIRDIYLDLADRFSKMSPQQANFFGNAIGLDQGTINLLEKGRSEVEKILTLQEKLGPATEKDAKAFQHLQTSVTNLGTALNSQGRAILTFLSPLFSGVADFFTDALIENGGKNGTPKAFTLRNNLGIDLYNSLFGGKSSGSGLSVFRLFQRLENSGAGAVSRKGAKGRNQIMPATAAQYGFDPKRLMEPAYNDMVARAIQADLAKRYHGDLEAMAIAYNAGPGRADAFLRNGRSLAGLPEETQRYVARERAMVGGAGASVTTIGTIVVNTRATDAQGIARDLRGALEAGAYSLAAQANQGPQ